MSWIGSTEMYLIWEVFGIMVMSSGLIIITGSKTEINSSKNDADNIMNFRIYSKYTLQMFEANYRRNADKICDF